MGQRQKGAKNAKKAAEIAKGSSGLWVGKAALSGKQANI
jgi:hypothetical protein